MTSSEVQKKTTAAYLFDSARKRKHDLRQERASVNCRYGNSWRRDNLHQGGGGFRGGLGKYMPFTLDTR